MGKQFDEFANQRLDPPSANSTSNDLTRDVIGSKTDDAVTSPTDTASIVAMLKGVLGGSAGPGTTYYVATTGSDSNAGTIQAPFLTIDYAVGQCTADNNDRIIVLPGTYDENAAAAGVTVDVAGITIVGSNIAELDTQTVVSNSHGSATAVFTVTADDCKFVNFEISEATATVEGMIISGDGNIVTELYLSGAMENGVRINGAKECIIEKSFFESMTNDGIEIAGTSSKNIIRDNTILDIADIAISLNGNGVDENIISDNVVNGGAGTTTTGIAITDGDDNMISGNHVAECGTDYSDSGSNNAFVANWKTSQITYTNTIQDDIKEVFDAIGGSVSDVGDVYYVGTSGTDTNPGTKGKPFLTIDYAIGQCTANNNDVVVVLPGAYDENVNTDGVQVDVEGLTIIGSNQTAEDERTTVVNSHASVTSVFNITAKNTVISNMAVIDGAANIGILCAAPTTVRKVKLKGTSMVDIQSADVIVEDCYFNGATIPINVDAEEALVRRNVFRGASVAIAADSADADNCAFYNNEFVNCTTGINFASSSTNNLVAGNHYGAVTNPITNAPSSTAFAANYQGSLINNDNTMDDDIYDIFSAVGGALGDIYYVATTGSDSNSGLKKSPFLTIDYAISQCTADNNDVIVVLPGTYDENANTGGVEVDVAGITIVGSNMTLLGGDNVMSAENKTIVHNSNGSATAVFTVSASNVKICKLYIDEVTNTVEGIVDTATTGSVYESLIFNGAMENGIKTTANSVIKNCIFASITNDGVELVGTANIVENNLFISCGDSAIKTTGAGASYNDIQENIIVGAGTTTRGVHIGAGSHNTIADNNISGVTTAILDSGTNTAYIENDESLADINSAPMYTLEDVRQKMAELWGADGANVFNPTIQGNTRADLKTALAQLATYVSPAGAAMSIQTFNQTARTSIEEALEDLALALGIEGTNVWTQVNNQGAPADLDALIQDITAVLGADGANVFNPTIDGSARTDLDAALQAIFDALQNGATRNTCPSRSMPYLTEYFVKEVLDATIWDETLDNAGTGAFAVEDGYMYYDLDTDTGANDDAMLNYKYRWQCRPATFDDTNTNIKKIILEFEMRTTGTIADVVNANFVFGFAETLDNDNTDNNIAVFTLDGSDNLIARTDDDGSDQDSSTISATLTNWNKYRIEVYATGYKFYVNDTLESTNETQVPDEAMYLVFGTRSDGVGAVGFDITNIRCFYMETADGF